MNELLSVSLNLTPEECCKNEDLLKKIDELLLTAGMRYSGIMNLYAPVDHQKRDQTVFQAEELLRNTDWLKGILAYTSTGTLTNACPLGEIQTDLMSNPSPHKVWYYEEYYQKTKQLPHGIVVDENKQLRDGYISYLLAQKYGAPADICEMVSEQPLRKIVTGRHVEFSHGKWRKKSEKRYVWIYPLKAPIVPGDILLANTKSGGDLICADSIDYIAGQEFCAKYKKIRKHMHMRMEKGEYTDHEK